MQRISHASIVVFSDPRSFAPFKFNDLMLKLDMKPMHGGSEGIRLLSKWPTPKYNTRKMMIKVGKTTFTKLQAS